MLTWWDYVVTPVAVVALCVSVFVVVWLSAIEEDHEQL
jgi:hypothetical protein